MTFFLKVMSAVRSPVIFHRETSEGEENLSPAFKCNLGSIKTRKEKVQINRTKTELGHINTAAELKMMKTVTLLGLQVDKFLEKYNLSTMT